MFTEEHLYCVSGIKIDNSDCLQQCSGIIVTSYDELDIDNTFTKLVKSYCKGSHFLKKMAKELQGSDKKS